MNRKQIAILVFFALADLAVVGLLGAYVVSHSAQATGPALPQAAAEPNRCELALTDSLSKKVGPAIVSWGQDRAYLYVQVAGMPSPTAESGPQALWVVFDALSEVPMNTCTSTDLITIQITASRSDAMPVGYVAQVDGATLDAWRRGELTDAGLARAARYRETGDGAN